MKMTAVFSSDIASVGYENGTLFISFHKGGLYAYKNVPYSVYAGLMNAPSKGKYFHANIRKQYHGTPVV